MQLVCEITGYSFLIFNIFFYSKFNINFETFRNPVNSINWFKDGFKIKDESSKRFLAHRSGDTSNLFQQLTRIHNDSLSIHKKKKIITIHSTQINNYKHISKLKIKVIKINIYLHFSKIIIYLNKKF